MNCREDIAKIGADVLGRKLVLGEVDKLEEAMLGRYEMYLEDHYDEEEPEAVDSLFNEDFYDNLKQSIEEMLEEKEE